MELPNLKQAPFNSTLMGAMRGALDYYGIEATTPWLYGASGHAFLMNIHKELCPSGPYCWDRAPFFGLLRNIGLATEPLGFFHAGSSPEERGAVEARLREALDTGSPCFLVNMEYQLITGYDETGLLTAQPWPGMDFPQPHITFGSWQELGEGIHIDFHILRPVEPIDRALAATAGLRYAVDLWRHPEAHTSADYGVGRAAYANWMSAVRAGHGSSHGNWWNGTVWAECRTQAAAFLREIGALPPFTTARDLPIDAYDRTAELVRLCADKALPDADKLAALQEACDTEDKAVARLEALLADLP